MIPVPLYTHHLDYDALVNDFMRATQYGNVTEQLKVILLKYREPPFLLTKTIQLLKFTSTPPSRTNHTPFHIQQPS
ncbi:unnamed protein product [Absidia cylindrospora]